MSSLIAFSSKIEHTSDGLGFLLNMKSRLSASAKNSWSLHGETDTRILKSGSIPRAAGTRNYKMS
jgi:hypothetical protein